MQKVSMSDSRLRFPAEWEPQSAILIAWPHAGTDWAERLAEGEETCIALVAAITRFQRALVCVADDDLEAYARARPASGRDAMERVVFPPAEYDDPWLSDSNSEDYRGWHVGGGMMRSMLDTNYDTQKHAK